MSKHLLCTHFKATSLRVMLQTCLWLSFLTIGAACLLLTACTVSEEVAVVTLTPTLTPTATMTMTETAVPPTPTPAHTATATPSQTPTHTATPVPTATHTPRPTRTPSSTPALVLIPTFTPEPAPGSWSRYQLRTMADLLLLTSDSMVTGDAPNQIAIESSEEHMHHSLIRVTFTGEFRELDPVRKIVIQVWSDTFAPDFKDFFQQEVLVTESGVDYWLPIQESLVPFMKDEVEVGGEMDVFIAFIGGQMLAEKTMDHVFVLNNFRLVAPLSYARVRYTGKFRELKPERKLGIQEWLDTNIPHFSGDVQHEVLITDGDVEYWLALPDFLIPLLKDEVEVGSEMDVASFIVEGNRLTDEKVDMVFLLYEFKAVNP